MQTSTQPTTGAAAPLSSRARGEPVVVNPAEDLSLNAPPHHVEARLVLILGFGTGMLIGVFFMIYIVLAVVSAPADSPGQALQLFHAATTPLM